MYILQMQGEYKGEYKGQLGSLITFMVEITDDDNTSKLLLLGFKMLSNPSRPDTFKVVIDYLMIELCVMGPARKITIKMRKNVPII